jgi:hypothetical protein
VRSRDKRRDGRPRCYACRKEGILDTSGYPMRAAVKAQVCFEPYVLSLCERHLALLQDGLPHGGVAVIQQYGPDGSAKPAT